MEYNKIQGVIDFEIKKLVKKKQKNNNVKKNKKIE